MAFKFSWNWRGYEADFFKPHDGAFLFALPPFFKTYVVTSDQREQLIGRLGRIIMVETYVSLIFVCAALALIASVAYPDFDISVPQSSLLGVLLVLALALLAFVFIVFAWRYFAVRGILRGAQVSSEKFTRADFHRNRVASMSNSRFKIEIAWRGIFNAVLLYFAVRVFWAAGGLTEWIAHFEDDQSDVWLFAAEFIVIALIVVTVSIRRMVRLIQFRGSAGAPRVAVEP